MSGADYVLFSYNDRRTGAVGVGGIGIAGEVESACAGDAATDGAIAMHRQRTAAR